MKVFWVWLYLLAGLVGGVGIGFVLAHRSAESPRPSSLPATPPVESPPDLVGTSVSGEVPSGSAESERLQALHRELGELKVQHQNLTTDYQTAQLRIATLQSELEQARTELSRLSDDLVRAEREVSARTPLAAPQRENFERQIRNLEEELTQLRTAAIEAPPPGASPPAARTVQLLRFDPENGLIAFGTGETGEFGVGSRWLLLTPDHSLAIRVTEVRAGFAIAREENATGLSALELASGESYRLTPLP